MEIAESSIANSICFFCIRRYTGKMNAVIIGGSGGIGAALSLALSRSLNEEELSLVLHGGSESEKFDSLIERLAVGVNSRRRISVTKLVQHLSARNLTDILKSPLYAAVCQADILCFCFGPFLQRPLEETTPDQWNEISFLNYTLPGICISAALPAMMRRKWGRILVFGGTRTEQVRGFETNAVYGGAKTALCSLVKSVAVSYASFGITCNAILPGFTETEYLDETRKEELRTKIPGNRLISVTEIADAGVFLLRHGEINGALLNIDCGWKP
jgi:NAD(P)-dependent dehydrogenase (short-subunit alcohol dehydrogenase family)